MEGTKEKESIRGMSNTPAISTSGVRHSLQVRTTPFTVLPCHAPMSFHEADGDFLPRAVGHGPMSLCYACMGNVRLDCTESFRYSSTNSGGLHGGGELPAVEGAHADGRESNFRCKCCKNFLFEGGLCLKFTIFQEAKTADSDRVLGIDLTSEGDEPLD